MGVEDTVIPAPETNPLMTRQPQCLTCVITLHPLRRPVTTCCRGFPSRLLAPAQAWPASEPGPRALLMPGSHHHAHPAPHAEEEDRALVFMIPEQPVMSGGTFLS